MRSHTCCRAASAISASILIGLVISLVCTAVFGGIGASHHRHRLHHDHVALGQIIWGLAYRWISFTGGDNGINVHGRPAPFGFDLGSANAFYYSTLVVFLVALSSP